jgi:NTP pyrophosphatase (non-canonical NTP hydrolase)
MPDLSVTDEVAALVTEREWAQFHTPENLAKSIVIEAAELLECYQWNAQADDSRVRDELADVLTYCVMLANRLGVDPNEIIRAKLAKTREKYPVDRARGRSTKYDAL